MDKTRVIKLTEAIGPLPCGTGDGEHACGRPAQAAFLDPGPQPGQWVLTPICAACAVAMAAMYNEEPIAVTDDA